MSPFAYTLMTTAAMAAACATLSVFVVSRRWAFIGEGISHSGFGGAGTAWLLGLAVPALDAPWAPYAGVVAFSFLTAAAIGYVTRERAGESSRTEPDTAIGIFMVASLAWGFVAQAVYASRRSGANPPGFGTFLYGDFTDAAALPPAFAVVATLTCLCVIAVVLLLFKEILAYCFDATTAEASGVRAGFVHYLLILLVTLTIVIGARVVGTVLVTALLILPGATAQAASGRLRNAVLVAVGAGLAGATAGLWASRRWEFLPVGPSVVLALFVVFLISFAASRLRR